MITNRNGFGNDSHSVLYITGEEGLIGAYPSSTFTESSKNGLTGVTIDYVEQSITPTHGDFGSKVLNWNTTENVEKGVTATSSDFLFGKQDYCIDFFIRGSAWAAGSTHFITSFVDASNYMSIDGYFNSGGYILWYWQIKDGGTDIINFIRQQNDVSLNTWYHGAFVRKVTGTSNERYDLYGNGVIITGVTRESVHNYQIDDTINIGKESALVSGNMKNVYVDNFRVSKGNKRWDRGFNIPKRSY